MSSSTTARARSAFRVPICLDIFPNDEDVGGRSRTSCHRESFAHVGDEPRLTADGQNEATVGRTLEEPAEIAVPDPDPFELNVTVEAVVSP